MCYMLVYAKYVTISSILLSFIRYFVKIVLFDPPCRPFWGVCCFLMSYNYFLYASVINEIEIRSDSLRFHIKILYFTSKNIFPFARYVEKTSQPTHYFSVVFECHVRVF